MGSPCCARSASGHAAATLKTLMNSRRFIACPGMRKGWQLRPSKQESSVRETGGRCGNVRRTTLSSAQVPRQERLSRECPQ
jgi:hypothetical protein